jgi:rubrerythrin
MSSDLEKVRAILDKAIETEQEGLKVYEEAIAKVKDPEAKEIFELLARAERGHIEMIEEVKAAEIATYSNHEWQGNFKTEITREIEEIGRLVVPEIGDKAVDATALEAIDIGIELEKKSIEFYTNAREQISELGTGNLFGMLISAERTHQFFLEIKRDSMVYGT